MLSGGGCELSPAKSWVAVWASAADSGSWSLGRGAGEAWAASLWEAECSASWGCGGGGDMGAYLRVQQRVGCGGLGGGGDGLGRDGDRGPAGGCWALTAQASIDCDNAALQRLQVAQMLGGLAGFVAMLLGLALCRARRILESGWRERSLAAGMGGECERAGSVEVVLRSSPDRHARGSCCRGKLRQEQWTRIFGGRQVQWTVAASRDNCDNCSAADAGVYDHLEGESLRARL